jgi:predicted glycoside hydrolase/deacetylase ChbG (UPF0249 family)
MQPNKMVGKEVSMTQSHDHTHYQENITSLLHDLHYVEKVTVHFHHDAAMKEKVENMLHGVNKTL